VKRKHGFIINHSSRKSDFIRNKTPSQIPQSALDAFKSIAEMNWREVVPEGA
jgi:hypothetical protein